MSPQPLGCSLCCRKKLGRGEKCVGVVLVADYSFKVGPYTLVLLTALVKKTNDIGALHSVDPLQGVPLARVLDPVERRPGVLNRVLA
jgi:hypothetical protein